VDVLELKEIGVNLRGGHIRGRHRARPLARAPSAHFSTQIGFVCGATSTAC
jgi:hypothetical protein